LVSVFVARVSAFVVALAVRASAFAVALAVRVSAFAVALAVRVSAFAVCFGVWALAFGALTVVFFAWPAPRPCACVVVVAAMNAKIMAARTVTSLIAPPWSPEGAKREVSTLVPTSSVPFQRLTGRFRGVTEIFTVLNNVYCRRDDEPEIVLKNGGFAEEGVA
jgi:hypothetical protein